MSRLQEATVTIERAPLEPLFHVRIWKRKRVFTLLLSDVAKSVVRGIIMAEASEKKQKRRTRVKRGLL
jgi:hypothetical protein